MFLKTGCTCSIISVGSRISQRGANHRVGGIVFAENCMKMKKRFEGEGREGHGTDNR